MNEYELIRIFKVAKFNDLQPEDQGDNIFPKKWILGDPIVEAQGIIRLPNGRVILGMAYQEPASAQSLICRS